MERSRDRKPTGVRRMNVIEAQDPELHPRKDRPWRNHGKSRVLESPSFISTFEHRYEANALEGRDAVRGTICFGRSWFGRERQRSSRRR